MIIPKFLSDFSRKKESHLNDALLVGILVSSISVIALFLLRLLANISFSTPLHIITSGGEPESLFALWKGINGLVVFRDFHLVPFAASYFNWAFYYCYGQLLSLLQYLFGFSDAWIPTVGRLITLVGVFSTLYILLAIQKLLTSAKVSLTALYYFLIVTIGPVVGFWAITVRPDIWATTAELFAIWALLWAHLRRKPVGYLLFVFSCYLAWSFKQTQIVILVTGCLWLFYEKKSQLALLLMSLFALTAGLTVFLGSAEYRYLLIFSQSEMGFSAQLGVTNLVQSYLLTLPMTIMGWIALLQQKKKKDKANPQLLLKLIVIFSGVVATVTATKLGASLNYFFTHLAVLSVLAASLSISEMSRRHKYILGGGIIVLTSLTIAISLGKVGKVSLRDQNVILTQIRNCVTQLPQPVLTYDQYDHYSSLPWINPAQLNFVRATTYGYVYQYPDKHSFQYGGIDGLINQGYFQSIVYQTQPYSKVLLPNGSVLTGVAECEGLEVWSTQRSL